jgi:hypothetical protein
MGLTIGFQVKEIVSFVAQGEYDQALLQVGLLGLAFAPALYGTAKSVFISRSVAAQEIGTISRGSVFARALENGESATVRIANAEFSVVRRAGEYVISRGGRTVRRVGTSEELADALCSFQNSCFVAGTPLLTATGSKPIEQFRVGDSVLSRSDRDITGPIESRMVEEVFVRSARLMELQVCGRKLKTTEEHPFWVRGKGWSCAKELRIGDELNSHDGRWVVVDNVARLDEVATVYNVRVSEYHTYFVGSEEWGFSIWAHNAEYVIVDYPGRPGVSALADRQADGTFRYVTQNGTSDILPLTEAQARSIATHPSNSLVELGGARLSVPNVPNPLAPAMQALLPQSVVAPRTQFPANESQLRHIFREAEGHIADTAANRALLQGVADDAGALLGADRFGNQWFARLNANGTQTWVQVRNGTIINGGVNQTPRTFNPGTGLSGGGS